MSASLEARRQAIADALRADAAESEQRARAAAVERRLDDLSSRLAAVETLLLEDAWGRPPAVPATKVTDATDATDAIDDRSAPTGDDDGEERVSVPAVPLGEGRMSSVASRVLFGH